MHDDIMREREFDIIILISYKLMTDYVIEKKIKSIPLLFVCKIPFFS